MDIKSLVESANKIWLSTHISADGDGIGSEIAFYHTLKNLNRPVQLIHNDFPAQRYQFLLAGTEMVDANKLGAEHFNKKDLCFIFDTHDPKLCRPLMDHIQKSGMKLIFVDHHVAVENSGLSAEYYIDQNASCTGELTLELIDKLNVKIDKKIATALYTSLIFDTLNFKNMRDPFKILTIALRLTAAGADHAAIYTELFENWTINKFNYLSKLITKVSYKNNDTAIIPIAKSDLKEFNLSSDDVSDIVDLFMGLKNLNVSIVVREEDMNFYKLSFRSRKHEILSWAREFGGGGHLYSAGAWVHDSEAVIMQKLNKLIQN